MGAEEAPGASGEGEVTRLLAAHRAGDRDAVNRLFSVIYTELHDTAHRQLARGRPGETLGTTALVNECYLKLVASAQRSFEDRRHFLAVAAKAMRQIVVDYARRSTALKRGGGVAAASLDPSQLADPGRSEEIVALDEAVSGLAAIDERLARLVECRFFGGLSVEETAEVLEISPRTVKRDWRKARALLFENMRDQGLA
jgi:RNA polymerase sigma factor (TIGR02999 family)